MTTDLPIYNTFTQPYPVVPGTYDEQRFDRLCDSLSEYLDDDGCTPERLLEDLRKGLEEGRKYFYGRVAAYDHVLGAIQL